MERILLVSATEKSRTMLSQFLTSCGVQAQLAPASSGAEARRKPSTSMRRASAPEEAGAS